MIPFTAFPKIPRLRRDCIITEKLDGSNALVHLNPVTLESWEPGDPAVICVVTNAEGTHFELRVGSRSRWITPGKATDNFGFAGWCRDNASELVKLGEGSHYGEWYGCGIQRGYGLTEKRFALFNTARWNPQNPNLPACCSVVPVLYSGPLGNADQAVEQLRAGGSVAVPGFMKPEGIILYHSAARLYFKQLLDNDDEPKGRAE
jgi:hypothetical protein